MPRYSYKVRDSKDKLVTGTIDGVNLSNVIETLEEKDYSPITVEELNFDGTKKDMTLMERMNEYLLSKQNKVPLKSVIFFTRQLATMLEGGVPLVRALEQLARTEKPVFKRIILQIADDISMGNTFSDSIAKHPGCFNTMYVSVVHSGEISGHINECLDQLADYLTNVQEMKAKVKAAMKYPMFIGGFVTILVIGILWKLVPIFENIYGEFGGKLPLVTQYLIKASHIVQNYFIWVIVSIIALIFGLKWAMTNKDVKLVVHTLILKIPVFGDIIRKNILSVYCRTMALLLDSGTPILQAVEISGAVVMNALYSNALKEVYNDLRKGDLLSTALENSGQFPPLIIQLVNTGEESGKVDDLLRKSAAFYEREIKNVVDSMAAIIEPFLLIILGGIVGFILVSMYLPIFSMGKLLK